MGSKFLCEFSDSSQVTIPKKLVDKLGLQPGDIIEIKELDGVLFLTPSFVVPKNQSWFFSKKWQEEEREIDESLQSGKGIKASDKEELFKILNLNS
jgi:antitoxin MazE